MLSQCFNDICIFYCRSKWAWENDIGLTEWGGIYRRGSWWHWYTGIQLNGVHLWTEINIVAIKWKGKNRYIEQIVNGQCLSTRRFVFFIFSFWKIVHRSINIDSLKTHLYEIVDCVYMIMYSAISSTFLW